MREEMPPKFFRIPENRTYVLEFVDWLIATKEARGINQQDPEVVQSFIEWVYRSYKTSEQSINVIRGLLHNTSSMWAVDSDSFHQAMKRFVATHYENMDYDFWAICVLQIFPEIDSANLELL